MIQFKVLTFNMQYGQVWDPADPDNAPVRLDGIIAELKKHNADIVHLQEVERVTGAAKKPVEPPPNYTRLRQALPQYDGYFSYPLADERELPFGYGLAILSKTPLFDQKAVHLPAPKLQFTFNHQTTSPTGRLLIAAKTIIGGRTIQLFCTHLQAFFMVKSSSDDFPEQRRVVVEQLRASRLPSIMTGDMNTAPGESTIAEIEKAGYRTAQKETITWKRMPYVLDHIFYNNGMKLQHCGVHHTIASDHEILTAEFALE